MAGYQFCVIAGLDPAIHRFDRGRCLPNMMDARVFARA
jgi:hypothetical protein